VELEKNDVWVGLFVVVSLLVILGTLVAIAQGRFGESLPLVARFDAIAGIQQGTPVVLRGYRVGEVKRIDFVNDPEIHFDVHLVITGDMHLHRGTRAIITSNNMIGDSYLLLDASTATGDTLRAGDVIPGESTQAVGDLVGRVNTVLAGAERTVNRLAETLRSASGEPGAAPPASDRLPIAEITQATTELRDLLTNINRVLAAAEPEIHQTTDMAQDGLREARFATSEAGSLVAENRQKVGDLIEHLDGATQSLDALVKEIHGIAAENRDEINGTLTELEKTSANLSRLSEDLADHPWKLLFR
jgi:phospholipid/cholesterol/gamma-HCH transport system substrate-binding protein